MEIQIIKAAAESKSALLEKLNSEGERQTFQTDRLKGSPGNNLDVLKRFIMRPFKQKNTIEHIPEFKGLRGPSPKGEEGRTDRARPMLL